MNDALPDFLLILTAPLWEMVTSGGSRRYWLFLFSGLLLAGWVALRAARRGDPLVLASVRALFQPDIWWHPSARIDYAVVSINSVLMVTVLGAMTVSQSGLMSAGHALLAGSSWPGLLPSLNVDPERIAALVLALYTLALFMVDDFLHFLSHTLTHKVSWLWAFHKLHHSAERLNPFTADRQHPVDLLFAALLRTVGTGLAAGLFVALLGAPLGIVEIAGSNVLLFLFNIAGGTLRHSPVWLDFGPRIDRWLISPAMHQIHHSHARQHWDRNMGGTLAIWDRIFGTLYVPQQPERLELGLGAESLAYRKLGHAYGAGFREALAQLGGPTRAPCDQDAASSSTCSTPGRQASALRRSASTR